MGGVAEGQQAWSAGLVSAGGEPCGKRVLGDPHTLEMDALQPVPLFLRLLTLEWG